MTHFRLDVTITSITSITSGFRPDVTLDGSLPGAHPKVGVRVDFQLAVKSTAAGCNCAWGKHHVYCMKMAKCAQYSTAHTMHVWAAPYKMYEAPYILYGPPYI